MSDKLQFVDASTKFGFEGTNKLKFIGHLAFLPLATKV